MIVNELIEDGVLLSASTSNSSTINMKDNKKRIWDIVAISDQLRGSSTLLTTVNQEMPPKAAIRYSISIHRLSLDFPSNKDTKCRGRSRWRPHEFQNDSWTIG